MLACLIDAGVCWGGLCCFDLSSRLDCGWFYWLFCRGVGYLLIACLFSMPLFALMVVWI